MTAPTARPLRLALVLATLPACAGGHATIREPVEAEMIVARDGAESLDARLALGAGKLHLSGGTCPLMTAVAKYDAAGAEPQVKYRVGDDYRGELDVRLQRDGRGSPEVDWRVCLTDQLPTRLVIEQGTGEATLLLGDVKLDALDVALGAGKTTIDLIGHRYRNTKAKLRIESGAGQVTLRVPRAVGVRVEVDKGIAAVNSDLSQRDGALVNDAYGKSRVSLEIEVDLGVGELDIESG